MRRQCFCQQQTLNAAPLAISKQYSGTLNLQRLKKDLNLRLGYSKGPNCIFLVHVWNSLLLFSIAFSRLLFSITTLKYVRCGFSMVFRRSGKLQQETHPKAKANNDARAKSPTVIPNQGRNVRDHDLPRARPLTETGVAVVGASYLVGFREIGENTGVVGVAWAVGAKFIESKATGGLGGRGGQPRETRKARLKRNRSTQVSGAGKPPLDANVSTKLQGTDSWNPRFLIMSPNVSPYRSIDTLSNSLNALTSISRVTFPIGNSPSAQKLHPHASQGGKSPLEKPCD